MDNTELLCSVTKENAENSQTKMRSYKMYEKHLSIIDTYSKYFPEHNKTEFLRLGIELAQKHLDKLIASGKIKSITKK